VIILAQNATRYIGTRFVGMKLSRTVAPGIARFAASAGIGGNGIVKNATDAPMAYLFPVTDAEVIIVSSNEKKGDDHHERSPNPR
jgi:hypothetical protein